MAQFNFDSSTVAPRDNNYELLPAGDYVAQVTESEITPLKSGNGQCLKLTVTVLQEGYNGRKIFCRLNVQHSNPTAEQIAQQQLRELCDAVGVVRMQDTTELHNKPFTARVKIRKSTDPQYTDQNEISGFKPAGGAARPAAFAAPRAAAPANAAQAPAAAAAGSTPPWAKKAA
jgi:hypothetical protein